MLLKVMYLNDKYDMVKPSMLNQLIESKKIKQFCRSGEWVDIEKVPLRGVRGNQYVKEERRTRG